MSDANANNIHILRDGKHFALEQEVYSRIMAQIHEYDERLSLVAALGVLELVKIELVRDANDTACN